MGALAKEGANFLIVEAPDYLYGAGVRVVKARGNKCLDGGEGAELVINTPCEDKFFVQATELGRLCVEELELPVYDAAIWWMLVV